MASLNKVILIGNVGNDPEVRYFDGGSVVARFNVATNESYTNRNNERVEQTEWFRVEVWNEQAKTIEKYLKKGQQIYVEGRLRTETYQDREGKDRFSMNVRAQTFQFLGGGRQDNAGGNDEYDAAPAATSTNERSAPRQQAAPQQTSAPAAQPAERGPAPAAERSAQPARKAAAPPAPQFQSNGDDDLPF